jgi:3-oxoacyl-[acyl-carrier protein] reductase
MENGQAGNGKENDSARSGWPVVLITGASAGIGEAISQRFAREGYRIVAVARGKEKLDRLVASLSPLTDIVALAGDVAAPGVPQQAVGLAMQKFGRLDVLVNNAGAGRWAPVDQTDDDMLNEVVDISLKAPFRFCRAALGVMKPGSSIITVGSTFGILGGLNGGIYCAVKAGLIGLTQTMAAQYGAQGVRANLVAPGVIKTDMTRDYWDEKFFNRINQEMTPFDREGTPEDVANAIYFLASDQGSYINGQTIALDGGWATTKYLRPEAMFADRVPPAAAK